ncbi:MAG TPA: asparagine synthase-related protein [Kofleriaceae bacterium]
MTVLYGVVARTERGRAAIAGLRGLPATFPRRRAGWWLEPEAGVALHAPIASSKAGALAIASSSLPGPGAGAGRLLRDLFRDPAGALAGWRGDAAVAVWDAARRQLAIGRDPYGQRGLFVREDEDVHWICSELAPLMADPGFACELDLEAAFHYLLTARTPPGATLAAGITRVLPAHLAVWRPGQPWLRQRFTTPLRPTARKLADDATRGEVRAALDAAVAHRFTPARQAILLSGGVDSSYLAARAARLAGGDHFDAYTIEFAAPGARNEVEFARLVAARYAIRHHVVRLEQAETGALIDRVLAADEPCAAWASVTHRQLLARVAGDGHRALWSGLGSDEVFGGYKELLHGYLKWRGFQTGWRPGAHVDAFAAALWHRRDAAAYLFAGNARFLDDRRLAETFLPPFDRWRDTSLLEAFYRECRQIKPGAHWFELAVAHECEHRIPDLLFVNFEPIARAHDLATAYPFLDLDVVPLACGLGATDRFEHVGRRWLNKRLLRQIAGEELPAVIMDRPLASYGAPIGSWLSTPAIARPLRAALHRSRLWRVGLVRRDQLPALEAAVTQELAGGVPGAACQRLWALITLAAWYDRWVEGPS